MNILVTGANGQLGTELRNAARESGDRYIFTDITSVPGVETIRLDITDIDAVRALAHSEKADVIVNCAAYTNVEKAEDEPEAASLLNTRAPEILAQVCYEAGATLIHISTDYVFGSGTNVPIRERDPKNPLGVYGATKLAGEQAIIGSGCRYLIFRTAWLYSPYGNNFVKSILRRVGTGAPLKVVVDQVGTPTYAADLAKFLSSIVESGDISNTGIYHFSDEGAVSWYDFAMAICELSGSTSTVDPCSSSEYPSKVERPHYSVLDKSLVKKTFGIRLPYWKDSLKDCMERLKPSDTLWK